MTVAGAFIDTAGGAVLIEGATGRKPDADFLTPATAPITVMNADDGSVTRASISRPRAQLRLGFPSTEPLKPGSGSPP